MRDVAERALQERLEAGQAPSHVDGADAVLEQGREEGQQAPQRLGLVGERVGIQRDGQGPTRRVRRGEGVAPQGHPAGVEVGAGPQVAQDRADVAQPGADEGLAEHPLGLGDRGRGPVVPPRAVAGPRLAGPPHVDQADRRPAPEPFRDRLRPPAQEGLLALLAHPQHHGGTSPPASAVGPAAARGRRRPAPTSSTMRSTVACSVTAFSCLRTFGSAAGSTSPRSRPQSRRSRCRRSSGLSPASRRRVGRPPGPRLRRQLVERPRPELPDRGRRQAEQLIRRPPHAVLLGDRHAEPALQDRVDLAAVERADVVAVGALRRRTLQVAAALDDRQAVGGVVPAEDLLKPRPRRVALPVPGELVGVDQPPGGHGPDDQPLGEPVPRPSRRHRVDSQEGTPNQ